MTDRVPQPYKPQEVTALCSKLYVFIRQNIKFDTYINHMYQHVRKVCVWKDTLNKLTQY